jgi:hypothetical protein
MARLPEPSDFEEWADRFERQGPVGKMALLGGGAVRLAARVIDRTLQKAAATVVDAEKAIKRELDPTMEEAKILEEWSGDRGETHDT